MKWPPKPENKRYGIRLGHSQESGAVLRYPGRGHLGLFGPSRGGKDRDVSIPFLLDCPDSVIVIDCKEGELSCVTSRKRRQFGEVIFLDPYHLVSRYLKDAQPSCYNPASILDPNSIEYSALAEKIGDALIVEEKGGDSEGFFTTGARSLCAAILMGLKAHAAPEKQNLISMRSVITGEFEGGVDVFGFAEGIMENSTDQALRQMMARYCGKSAKESRSVDGIIHTAEVQTGFLSDPALIQSLSASDFTFKSLTERVVTVYVVLPMKLLDVKAKYLRLIVAAALSELLNGK
jgi:type IV secretory pathway TraG/TraD family ATPase VirD4